VRFLGTAGEDEMQVFIAWGGEVAGKIARKLSDWLPNVLQSITPFVSPNIEPGSRWLPKLSGALSKSDAGVLCLTSDSIHSPWLLFEAGGLAGGKGQRPLYGILFNVTREEVPDPLTQFQLSQFSKDQVREILKSLNSLSGKQKVDDDVLHDSLERLWPELDNAIKSILAAAPRGRYRLFHCAELADRAEMYRRISKLLMDKKEGWVYDTTWGNNPPEKMNAKERKAFDEYVAARRQVLLAGVSYKELMSFTVERFERISESIAESAKESNYDVKILEKRIDVSVPDFLVTDSGEIIISHVDVGGSRRKYLDIKCPAVAAFYAEWFNECWESAIDPTKTRKA
jgi:hypothetical protein